MTRPAPRSVGGRALVLFVALSTSRWGCGLVGWRPVLDYADAGRVLDTESPAS